MNPNPVSAFTINPASSCLSVAGSTTGLKQFFGRPMTKSDSQRRSRVSSEIRMFKLKQLEDEWKDRFTLCKSKKNPLYNKNLRQYFDTQKCPILFTPIKTGRRKKSASRNRIAARKNRNRWSDVYTPFSEFNVTKHCSHRKYF